MSQDAPTYTFQPVLNCRMCGHTSSDARVLGKRLNRSQGIRPTHKTGICTTVVKCRHCELVYSNPLPIPATIDQHYGIPAENYWKPEYFKVDPKYFQPIIDLFFSLHPKESELRSLDIGAGIGKAMIAMQGRGFDAYGLEPSAPFYERAIEIMKVGKEKLQLTSQEAAQYPEKHFHFITFGAVLEHLYDPAGAIEQALRWLKPNGLIHIEVPSSAWLTNRIYNGIYRIQGLDYAANISPMHTPFHLYEFGLKSFQKHAASHGYEIALHQYMVAATFLPRLLDPLLKPYMAKTNTGMQLMVWLRKQR